MIKKQYKKGNACLLIPFLAASFCEVCGSVGSPLSLAIGSRSHFGSRARREPVFWPWRFVFVTIVVERTTANGVHIKWDPEGQRQGRGMFFHLVLWGRVGSCEDSLIAALDQRGAAHE